MPARLARRPPVRRSGGGSVSGSFSAATVNSAAPMTASSANTPRQSVTRRMNPPASGATSGTVPEMRNSRANIRAVSVPDVDRSRTVARAIDSPVAPAMPCRSRSTSRTQIEGATAHSSDATANSPTPASSGMRRPRASLMGPARTCPSASPTIDVVIVSWAADADAGRSRAISGRAGRYRSIDSGPNAVRAPSRMYVPLVPEGRAGAAIPEMMAARPRSGGAVPPSGADLEDDLAQMGVGRHVRVRRLGVLQAERAGPPGRAAPRRAARPRRPRAARRPRTRSRPRCGSGTSSR